MPGTVLDTGVTVSGGDEGHEFFLLTSTSKFGISQPTKFRVLFNSLSASVDEVHLLSYKLCHTYFNIPTAVQKPAPILYARKLARQTAERSIEVTDEVAQVKPLKVHPILTQKAPGLYFL